MIKQSGSQLIILFSRCQNLQELMYCEFVCESGVEVVAGVCVEWMYSSWVPEETDYLPFRVSLYNPNIGQPDIRYQSSLFTASWTPLILDLAAFTNCKAMA